MMPRSLPAVALLAVAVLAAAGCTRTARAGQTVLEPSGGTSPASFGRSVSLSRNGTAALLGAHNSSAAFVFGRSSGSSWAQQAELHAPDDIGGDDEFGASVSLSGDGGTALVGAPGGTGTGSAFVFVRAGGSSWTQQARLLAADAANDDRLGESVALSGDGGVALVGAPFDDHETGSAYVFVRSGSSWTQEAKLRGDPANSADEFGCSVSLSADGGVALVGARQAFFFMGIPSIGTWVDSGAAFVFVRSGASWSQQARLLAEDGAPRDFFGASVSLSADGGTALVGAYFHDGGDVDSGSAYVFERSGASWAQQAKLLPEDRTARARFGHAVSLSADGGAALIGALASGSGSMYLFLRSGSGPSWGQAGKDVAAAWAASVRPRVLMFGFTALTGDGSSVSLSGDGNTALTAIGEPLGGSNVTGLAYASASSRSSSAACPLAHSRALFGCFPCPAGFFCPLNSTGLTACDEGEYCPAGLAERGGACPAGSFCATPAATTVCPVGSFCPEGSAAPTACDEGEYCPAGLERGGACPAGSFCATPAATTVCPAGSFCPEGSTAPIACDAGEHCAAAGASRGDLCPAGFYCSTPTAISRRCPSGSFCPEGATAPVACDAGEYCPSSGSSERGGSCPAGSFCSTPAASAGCPAGSYCPEGSSVPNLCDAGHLCPEGAAAQAPCDEGHFCPAGSSEATLCSTCGDGETTEAACTAEADTRCREQAKSDGLLRDLILFGAAVVAVLLGLWLAARHVVHKRSRRGHPLADRVRTLLKLGGVADFHSVRGQTFAVFVDDASTKMAQELGVKQEELAEDDAAANAIAVAVNAAHGFVEDGPCGGGCSRGCKRPSEAFMNDKANADAVASEAAARFRLEAAGDGDGPAASSSAVSIEVVELEA